MKVQWIEGGAWSVEIGEMRLLLAPTATVGSLLTKALRSFQEGRFEESKDLLNKAMQTHDKWLSDNPGRKVQQTN